MRLEIAVWDGMTKGNVKNVHQVSNYKEIHASKCSDQAV